MNSRPEQNFRLQSDEKQPMPGTKILWMATKKQMDSIQTIKVYKAAQQDWAGGIGLYAL